MSTELFSPTYLEELKRSKQQVGFLNPVLVDQEGKIIDGRHRKAIYSDWPEIQKEVQSPIHRLQMIIHQNLRRVVSQSETRENLIKLAIELKKTGLAPGEIVKRVHDLVPYTEAYIRMLLPSEFKDSDHRASALQQDPWNKDPVAQLSCATEQPTQPAIPPEESVIKLKRIVENFEQTEATIILPFQNCACATCPNKNACYG